jgi:large subunit ribosomal protein L4
MADVKTFDAGSGKAGTAELDSTRLSPAKPRDTNRGLHPVVLREAVIMYEANKRVGTVSTKERHFVSGNTKKMYKQKHTGNARQGDGKAPHFRGGGVCFGPHPRDFSYAMPKKALRKALAVALSRKIDDGEVIVVSGISFDAPSTKSYAKFLAGAKAEGRTLLVTAGPADRNLLLSARNVPYARILPAAEVNARDIAECRHLLLDDGAYDVLVSRANGEKTNAGASA